MKFISKLKSKYFLEFVIAFILLCTVGTAVGIAQEVDEAVSLLAAEDPNRELTPEDIPDSILFSALVALADYNGDGKLTVLELNTYSGDEQGSLDLSNLNITDIKGLGYAKGVSSINLSLNNSITVIPDNAFAGCKNLVEIIIPESVVKIGNSAFSGCDKLEIINLPDVLSEIGESSFLNCTSLKEIKLPSKIAKIGSSAFSGCGLLEIEIPYNPENPVRLGANVFNSCTSLSNVILHEGMKSIPVGCFNNTAITGINLPKSVEVIEEKAFCNTNLTNLDLSGYSKLVSIKSGAFSNNYFLNKVVLPEALTELGSNAFENCIILTEIKIPKGITVINDFTFSDCISLHNVIFTPFEVINGENNYKIEEIGNGAFYGCFGLGGEDGKVEFLKNLNNLKKIGDYCFANGAIDTKEKDEEYGETIYYGFRSIVLPDSIQTIGKYAFANCYTLETVNIPYNVTLLDDYTFSKCYNLNEVIFIKDGVQYDDVPKLKAIGTNCFEYCYSLNTINLPSSLETIGAAAFRYCAKEKVREVNKQKEYLYTGLKELYLPDSISSIGNNAFQNCFNLEYVKLPANLKQINNYLFSGCGIQLKDSKGKEIVGSYKGIKTVVFPNNLESIGNYAFNSCYVLNLNESQLGDYTGNHTIKSIGRNAFEKCYSLRKLVIPYTLESIGQSAFESCINLESVDFESYSANLSAIGSSAFKNTAIKGSVVLPEKLSKVENNVFENCYFITSVEFPDGLTSVGSASFKNCNNLTTIKLPASAALVHSGDNSSFYGCIALSNSILKAVPADLSVYANSKGIVPIKCLTQITKAEVQNEQIATAIIDASGSMPVVNIFGVDDGRTSVEINGFMRFESGKDSNGIIYVIEVNTKVEFNINVTAIHCEEVRFTESRRGVALNKTITLQPVILPVETTDIRTWTSDNESVATVDSNGKVTALSYGSTTIRLKVGDQPEVQCQINVCAPANGFTMNTNSVNLYLDDEANNTYKVPYSITYHSNYKDFKDAYPDVIIWSSSDENVATVDQNGNIKVVGYGEARITARADAGNKTDSIDVAVLPSHTTVSFDKTEITVQKGESAQIIITLDPEKSPISKIKIQSSDKSIAVVNRNNNIITISGISGGSAKITASPEKGTAAECMVYVKSPLSSITASPMEIYKGATKTISLVKTPQDTTDTLIYTSSNPEIAQVDSNGKVTALKAGTVVINISSVENPTITAQCTVTVKVAVSSVSLNKTSLTLAVGDSYKLTATISPEDASNKDIGWTSSKPDIVSVDNGVITAVSDGSSVITVNTADGNKTARCVVTVVKNPVSINSISSNFSDNGSIVVSGEVKNIVDVDKTVTVIYALYDSNNKLKGLAKETITIAQKTTMKLQKEINVSGDLRNYTAKIMLWDSDFGTLKPLSESKSKSI